MANRERGRDFERGGTAHTRAHRNVGINRSVKAASVNAPFAKLLEHAFDVIGPGRLRIFLQIINEEPFALGKSGGSQFDSAIGARRRGDPDMFIYRDSEDQAVVIIRVIAKEFEPARRLDDVSGLGSKLFLKERGYLRGGHDLFSITCPLWRPNANGSALTRSATVVLWGRCE